MIVVGGKAGLAILVAFVKILNTVTAVDLEEGGEIEQGGGERERERERERET